MCYVARGRVFFFNDTATTEIYTLSLHDALPISRRRGRAVVDDEERADLLRARDVDTHRLGDLVGHQAAALQVARVRRDRKSTRLNSSHANISYAVFCLKKKKLFRSVRMPTPLII